MALEAQYWEAREDGRVLCKLCPQACLLKDGQKGLCRSRACDHGKMQLLNYGKTIAFSLDPIEKKSLYHFHPGSQILSLGPNSCNLQCSFCQNYQISEYNTEIGIEYNEKELAELMFELQKAGAETINLVTGTHFAPSIINSLEEAKKFGLKIPIVWNTSGYETVETLELIDPFIDMYLFDLKTLSRNVAKVFCGRKDYVDAVLPALEFLLGRHKKEDLIIRHLVFPGTAEHTKKVIEWFGKNAKDKALFSLMVQFVSPFKEKHFDPVTKEQYDWLMNELEENNIEDGFIQELGCEDEWIPDFTRDNPFPEDFAVTLPFFQRKKEEL